jgi:hypothetical protein
MAVATLITVVTDCFRRPTPPLQWADTLIVTALLSFIAFAGYWNLLPPMQES